MSASVGILATVAAVAPRLAAAPGIAVLVALGAAVGAVALWGIGVPKNRPISRGRNQAGSVRGAATVALSCWVAATLAPAPFDRHGWIAVGVSLVVAVWAGVAWLATRGRWADPSSRALLAALGVALLAAAYSADALPALAGCGAIYALVAAVLGPRPGRGEAPGDDWWNSVLEHPERLLVATFATLGGLGAVLLAMPQSAVTGASIGAMDAAFTSVSAVCVTGLIVRDTPHEFSGFGLVVILALIQLGGLGIMTFSTAALRMLGGRMSIRQESAVARVIGARDRSRVIASAQDVLRVTFLVEALGAVLLTVLFISDGEPLGSAAWRGCFTAVSAYCNAGFALQSDSLAGFQDAPGVLHTVSALIILGGMSPAILLAVGSPGRRGARLSLQGRICLSAAAALLLAGFLLFLAWEWDGVLSGMPLGAKLHNAWLQSATLRTAGFNSIDPAAVRPATYVMMLCMMFIGASPGGTAGGVKTTTVAVLVLSVVHTIRGRPRVTAFGRRVPERTVQKAAAIVTVATLLLICAVLALSLTQSIPLGSVVFEAVSALGTVGLSQGATPRLDEVGKAIILVCMFVGRVGGLTLFMFMSQGTAVDRIRRPTEEVDVG